MTLIERIEAAESGSRELDVLIWAHFLPERVEVKGWNECWGNESRTQVMFTLPPKRTERVTTNVGPYLHAEPCSTSTDAALALVERVLPEVWPGFQRNRHVAENARWSAWLAFGGNPETIEADAKTLPLAIIAALLKAKETEK